ncbi:hypothetical protein LTR75_003121 [Friedmanniomyces endolithicus]|nr:hypothetical protein LTR75_003121 [Friedmanniomyces endolithicus]
MSKKIEDEECEGKTRTGSADVAGHDLDDESYQIIFVGLISGRRTESRTGASRRRSTARNSFRKAIGTNLRDAYSAIYLGPLERGCLTGSE